MVYFLFLLVAVCADQLTKGWIVDSFQLHESREIVPAFFNLVYVTNSGAAFSMFAGVNSPWRHYFFLVVGIIAIIGLTVAWFRLKKENGLYGIALGLISGGAAGNIIDRIRYGSVVDFLDFHFRGYHWPAFNLADSAICVGAGLFLIINIIEVRKTAKEVK
jgi:signal peptidase II